MSVTPAYVSRAARNAVIDAMRAQGRRESVCSTYERQVRVRTADAPGDPSGADPILGRTLRRHLERLASEPREAIDLYLGGEQIREIADHLGWNAKKANNTVFRGLARLRRGLADEGIMPRASASIP